MELRPDEMDPELTNKDEIISKAAEIASPLSPAKIAFLKQAEKQKKIKEVEDSNYFGLPPKAPIKKVLPGIEMRNLGSTDRQLPPK